MASLGATHSSDRIISKLYKLIESNEFYEAHQLYRTIYFRYLNSRRYKELENLLYEGAISLLTKQQYTSGADLANLFIDTLSKDPAIPVALEDEIKCNHLCCKIGELVSLIPPNTPERLQFIMISLKLKPSVFPIPLIHRQFALVLWKEKNFQDSRYHFIHSGYCSEDCAQMLIEYHITCGYPSEVDLFIAQFILQLLCCRKSSINGKILGNCCSRLSEPQSSQHALANVTLQSYTAKHPQIQKNDPPFLLPLINFLWFLLIAIEKGKSSTFNVLCDSYAIALKRDPSYKEYLSRIGELYFGLESPARHQFGGFLNNLLQTFLDDDENASQNKKNDDNVTEVKSLTSSSADLD